MKIDEITIGHHKVGPFDISIQFGVVRHPDFFHLLIIEERDGLSYYVDLVHDTRFMYFHHMTGFVRKLVDDDIVEYNYHAGSVFHKILMPTFLLGRHSIVNIFETCQSLAKKIKKQSQMAKRQEI